MNRRKLFTFLSIAPFGVVAAIAKPTEIVVKEVRIGKCEISSTPDGCFHIVFIDREEIFSVKAPL